jgi:hypothetical protein
VTSDEMSAEFQQVSRTHQLTELITCLHEVRSKDAAFAMATCSDAVLAVESLLKSHTNAGAACIETRCSTFSAALFNSSTDYNVNIVHEENSSWPTFLVFLK